MGLIYNPRTGGLAGTVYDNRPPGPDAALDTSAATLWPLDRSRRSNPPPQKGKKLAATRARRKK
jgi:hypothetical protein